MSACNVHDILVTGVGVTSSIGRGSAEFSRALLEGSAAFSVMRRPGRQRESSFLGAEIPAAIESAGMPPGPSRRHASFAAQVAVQTLHEAWQDAGLGDVDPTRIGLIVGGSNFQQRELIQTYENYAGRLDFLRPTYGMSFMDTDVCGLCTEQFGILGPAYTLGGASASGQLAVIRAIQAVAGGEMDVCIALGALMDLSHWECRGLRALGAMGSDRFAEAPELACRPFDQARDGFIYGENCGAVVVERLSTASIRPSVRPYARASGWGVAMDGNRNPDPSLAGEVRAIQLALQCAGWTAEEVDYVNPHGSGSVIGDETELTALRATGLAHAYLNATKSIVGHGLSAAGAVEVIATVLQMRARQLHPTRNLEDPIEPSFNWVRGHAIEHATDKALSLSIGFGGINTALCLQKFN
jgi:malonyl-ACP decarboxylase